jgi:hypothetical protein
MTFLMLSRLRGRFLAAVALALGLLAVIGCGSKDAYQVSGRAQYKDGSPITGGFRVIRLEPGKNSTAKIRKGASGMIAEDGTFELFTRKPGDGVYAGEYVVTFSVLTKSLGGTSLIPAYYTHPESTPFNIVVDDDKEGLVFELDKL